MLLSIRLFKENWPTVWGPHSFEGDLAAAYEFAEARARKTGHREVYAEIKSQEGQTWVRWLGK
jgi:hypothetical protein